MIEYGKYRKLKESNLSPTYRRRGNNKSNWNSFDNTKYNRTWKQPFANNM